MHRLKVLAAVAVAALLAWAFWPSNDMGPAPDAVAQEPALRAATDAAVAAVEAPAVTPTVEATAQRTEAPAADPAPVALGPECTLRGRCIDAHGNPIAGVKANLHGWGANSARQDAWLKDHDEVKPSDQTVTSGADGVFEFRFWPPPPFQFALDLSAPGFGSMTGRWGEFAPGSTRDLGDITMLPGTLLLGRVVDSNGAVATNVEVHFDGDRNGNEENVTTRSWEIGYVRKADGMFRGRWPMPPGTYKLDVPHRTVVSPKQIVLDGAVPELFVDVVIEALDDSNALTGVVVDEQGAPVRNVTVDPIPRSSGQHWIISTDKEGRFRVAKEAGSPDPVPRSFRHPNFEGRVTTEQFAWGRNDVRVTLQRRPSFEVLVVKAADETPVEDYQLRVLWPGNSTSQSSSDFEVRGGTHHEGGRLRIDGASRGAHLLFVTPRDSELASGVLEIEVQSGNPAPVVVRLNATARRELRIQRADGTPIAGARVQLADASMIAPSSRQFFAAMPGNMQVMPMEQWAWNANHVALELMAGVTDASGTFVLRGPGGRDLLLRLPGPPNTPQDLPAVRLDVADPLVITVSTGAKLEGTVGPAEMIAELRRNGGLSPTPQSGEDEDHLPYVQLTRSQGGKNEVFPPPGRRAAIAADGTFALDGIPPGTWTVHLGWTVAQKTWSTTASQACGEVALEDGATVHFDIDASFVAPGDLDGSVLRNGVPLADTDLMLFGGQGESSRSVGVTTDKEGRFHARVRGGDYRVMLQVQQGQRWLQLTSLESASIVAGRTVTQTFRIDSGTARVRVLDTAGNPVAAVTIELRNGTAAGLRALAPTGADGRAEGLVEPGSFTVTVWPRRLQDPEELRKVFQQNPGNPDPLASLRIPLGDVVVALGQTQEVTLRLPADW